jgi:hypothetical protein
MAFRTNDTTRNLRYTSHVSEECQESEFIVCCAFTSRCLVTAYNAVDNLTSVSCVHVPTGRRLSHN